MNINFKKVIELLEELHALNDDFVIEKVIENLKMKEHCVDTNNAVLIETVMREISGLVEVINTSTYLDYHKIYSSVDKALVAKVITALENLYSDLNDYLYKLKTEPRIAEKKRERLPNVDYLEEEVEVRDRLPNNFIDDEFYYYPCR